MGNVLFVDDEKLILNSIRRGLKGQPYNCFYAESGEAALELLKVTEMDVIFSDMKMPKMTGLELLKTVDSLYPDMVKVILSGYAQLPQLIATINQANIFKYIAKPWDLDKELIPVIEQSIEYAQYKKSLTKEKETLESKNAVYQNLFKTITSKAEVKDQNWDLIKIFFQIFMNTLKDQVSDRGLDQKTNGILFEHYRNFFDNFLSEIKKGEIRFEPKRIINDVVSALKKDAYHVKVEMGVDETAKKLYHGRITHVKPILIALIEDLIKKESDDILKIISTEISRDNQLVSFMYIIEGNQNIFSNYDMSHYNIKLYKRLLNIFGGDLEFKETAGKLAIFVKVRMYLAEEEDEFDEHFDRG